MALAVLASLESDQNLVQQYYQEYLNRLADSEGLVNWAAYLQQGGPAEDVIAGILGSDEFFTTA